MNYLSLFSGIEAATLAFKPLGWKAAGFSEIAPFPCAVLAHHYPHVPNFGDVAKFKDWKLNATVDLICGGSPCQSFSAAGNRKGMADPRGQLTRTYLDVVEHFKPRWLLWENVPGVLSADKGEAFKQFTEQLAKIGYCFAWRILDAQYFGVPQRRRRVFLVGYFGDVRPAAAVLFEPKGSDRHIEESKSRREENPAFSPNRLRTTSGKDIFPTLLANCGTKQWLGNQEAFSGDYFINHPFSAYRTAGDGAVYEQGDKTAALTQQTDPNQNIIAYWIQGNTIGRQPKNGGNGVGYSAVNSPTLTGGTPFSRTGGENMEAQAYVAPQGIVRRLTPKECARLQGFPDDYLDITYRGKPATDTPKYQALGNSWAVPVARWVGERIALVNDVLGEAVS